MRVRVDVSGADDVIAQLKGMGPKGIDVAKRVLGNVTARIVPRAKAITPVEPEDGGDLRDSVRATKPTRTRTGLVSAGVVAGGAPLRRSLEREGHTMNVYAVVQHEDLTLQHTVGQAKFIERPFMAEIPKVPGELLAGLDEATNG